MFLIPHTVTALTVKKMIVKSQARQRELLAVLLVALKQLLHSPRRLNHHDNLLCDSILPRQKALGDEERRRRIIPMSLFIFRPNQLVKLSLGEVGSADAINKELTTIRLQ